MSGIIILFLLGGRKFNQGLVNTFSPEEVLVYHDLWQIMLYQELVSYDSR